MKGFGTYFKTSMALVANWYVLIGFWAIIVWRLALDTFWDPLTALAMVADFIFLGAAWKQTLWNPVFGSSAVLNQALPVSKTASTLGKILAAGIGLGIMLTTVFLAFLANVPEMGDDLYRNAGWINWINHQLMEWMRLGGLTAAGILKLLLVIWIPSFLTAGLAYLGIALIGKRKYEN